MLYDPKPSNAWTVTTLHARLSGAPTNLSHILHSLERWERTRAQSAAGALAAGGMLLTTSKDLNTLSFRFEFQQRPTREQVREAHAKIQEFADFLSPRFKWKAKVDPAPLPSPEGAPFLVSGIPTDEQGAPIDRAQLDELFPQLVDGRWMESSPAIAFRPTAVGALTPVTTWVISGLLHSGASEQTLGNFASLVARAAHWRSVRIQRFGLGTVDLEHGCYWSDRKM